MHASQASEHARHASRQAAYRSVTAMPISTSPPIGRFRCSLATVGLRTASHNGVAGTSELPPNRDLPLLPPPSAHKHRCKGRGCTPSETAQLRNFARNCAGFRFPGRGFVIALRVVGSCGVATSLVWFSMGGRGFGYCPLGWGGLNFWIWVLCQAKPLCGPAGGLAATPTGLDSVAALPRVATQPWATLRNPFGVGEKLSEGRGARDEGCGTRGRGLRRPCRR
jgi:hypothetical protein